MFRRRAFLFLLLLALCYFSVATNVAAEEPLYPQQTIAEFSPLEGIIGSTIIVTGTGFSGSHTAWVGDTRAKLEVESDTKAFITVPPMAKTGLQFLGIFNAAHAAFSNVPYNVIPTKLSNGITISGPLEVHDLIFQAIPSTIYIGSSATLVWSTQNMTGCVGSGGWSGTPSGSGTLVVTPTTTTAYTLTCQSATGPIHVTATVIANPLPPAAAVTLSANPTTITSGSSSTLAWSSTNATSCVASNGWTGAKSTSGSLGVSPTTTTTYTLTCTGAGGASSPTSTTVTVTANPAPTVTISASPTSITSGNSSTLTWSSTNATSCTASSGWTGIKSTSGSLGVSPTTTTTYTLTCTGAGGTTLASTTVVVSSGGNLPSAPSQVLAYVGGASTTAYVIFAAPTSNGGSAITSYVATASPSGITATSNILSVPGGLGTGLPRRVDFSGLPNTTQTFTVAAINSSGAGPASSASNAITPAAYSDFYIACGGPIVGLNPLWSGSYNFNANYYFVAPGTPSHQGPGTFSAPTNPITSADNVLEVNPVATPYELQLYVKADNPATTSNGVFNSTPFSYITFQVYPTQSGQTMNFPAWETTFNFEGVVTAGTNTTTELTDNTQNWPVNQFHPSSSGVFNRTKNLAQAYVSNTATTVNFGAVNTAPSVGDHYYIQVGDVSVGSTLSSVATYNTTNPGSFLANQWNTVKIPLSAFNIGSVDNNLLYKFHVGMSNMPNTIYFANIAFTNH